MEALQSPCIQGALQSPSIEGALLWGLWKAPLYRGLCEEEALLSPNREEA